MKSFHNTTNETDLFGFEAKAQSQDAIVLEFLQSRINFNPTFTCEDIHNILLTDAPLTSARRAVSNLFNAGLIEKVGKVQGKYKRPIYLWRLK